MENQQRPRPFYTKDKNHFVFFSITQLNIVIELRDKFDNDNDTFL